MSLSIPWGRVVTAPPPLAPAAAAGAARRCLGWRVLAGLLLVPFAASAAPPDDRQWEFRPDLSDDFEAEALDSERWTNLNPYYLGRKPGAYARHNVVQTQGMLNLWAQNETLPRMPASYKDYSVAYVAGQRSFLYGYVEVRARVMDNEAVSAAWLYHWSPEGTGEIDIFEVAGGNHEFARHLHTNAHVHEGDPALETDETRRSYPLLVEQPHRIPDDFRTFGLEWDALRLRYYYEGQLIRTQVNHAWHKPMSVRFTVETHPDWKGLPSLDLLPAVFQIDHVKVWQPR